MQFYGKSAKKCDTNIYFISKHVKDEKRNKKIVKNI